MGRKAAEFCRKADSCLKAEISNININGKRGSSSNITTSRSSNTVANNSIISDPLSGRGSQRRREDLVRDPVVTLNSHGGNRELPEPGVSEGTAVHFRGFPF